MYLVIVAVATAMATAAAAAHHPSSTSFCELQHDINDRKIKCRDTKKTSTNIRIELNWTQIFAQKLDVNGSGFRKQRTNYKNQITDDVSAGTEDSQMEEEEIEREREKYAYKHTEKRAHRIRTNKNQYRELFRWMGKAAEESTTMNFIRQSS